METLIELRKRADTSKRACFEALANNAMYSIFDFQVWQGAERTYSYHAAELVRDGKLTMEQAITGTVSDFEAML